MPSHVAGDAGVVHDHDRAHVLVEQRRQVLRGRGPACRGSMSQKSRPAPCRANASAVRRERERRDDDRVAGPEVEQHRRQLEGRRARGGHQHLGGAGLGEQELGGPLREGAAGRRVAASIASWTYSSSRPSTAAVERDVRQLCGGTVLELAVPVPRRAPPSVVRLVAGHHGSGRPSWSASRALLSSKYASSVPVTPASSTGATPGARVDRLAVGDRRTSPGRRPRSVTSAGQHRGVGQQLLGEEHVRGRGEGRGPGLEVLDVATALAGRRRATPTCAAGPTAAGPREVRRAARPRGRGSRGRCSVLNRQLETARRTGSRSSTTTSGSPSISARAARGLRVLEVAGALLAEQRLVAGVREVRAVVPVHAPARRRRVAEDLGLGRRRSGHRDLGVRVEQPGSGRSCRTAARR